MIMLLAVLAIALILEHVGGFQRWRTQPRSSILLHDAGPSNARRDAYNEEKGVIARQELSFEYSFERSEKKYEDKPLAMVALEQAQQKSASKEDLALHDMISLLRTNQEFKRVRLVDTIGMIVDKLLPEGVDKEEEVCTQWVPGGSMKEVLPYKLDEIKGLDRASLYSLMTALGSCDCPITYVVHVTRAVRAARRLSSKLLYMGVKNAIRQNTPLSGFNMLKEGTQLSAVSYSTHSSPKFPRGGGGEGLTGYHKVVDDMGTYRGYLKDGMKEGYGTYSFDNGEVFEGFFRNDELLEGRFKSNYGSVYEGQIQGGKMHGKGIFKLSNGDVYEGDFYQSNRHGRGVYLSATDTSGERYEGHFDMNKKHGKGTVYMTFPSRHVYVGDFEENCMQGNGTVFFENGDVYVGELVDNRPHGYGTYYCNVPPEHLPADCDFEAVVEQSIKLVDEELSGDSEGATSGRTSIKSEMLSEALAQWETLAGKVEHRPAERERRRRQRAFTGKSNSYVYRGEWRHNQREGLGHLETLWYAPRDQGDGPGKEGVTVIVYDGEWSENREHGVGVMWDYSDDADSPRRKEGVWRLGSFEREFKGFGSPLSSAGGGDAGGAITESSRNDAKDGDAPSTRAPDDYVKKVLQADEGTLNGASCRQETAVSMGTRTDRAALFKALESADRARKLAAEEKHISTNSTGRYMSQRSTLLGRPSLNASSARDPLGAFDPTETSPAPVATALHLNLGEESHSPSLSSGMGSVGKRDGVIYVPKADRQGNSKKNTQEKQPLEARWGRHKANKNKNSTQGTGSGDEASEDLWRRGYLPQEPPGNDVGEDMDVFYLPHIDITTLDELLDELTYVGEVETAVELIEGIATRKFGESVVPTLSTYGTVAISAGRLGRPDIMLRVLRYATLEQSRSGLILFSETLFLTALNVCAIAGDYTNALLIFGLYEERYGVVQHKAYLLLLASYVSASHTKGGAPDDHPDKTDRSQLRSGSRKSASETGRAATHDGSDEKDDAKDSGYISHSAPERLKTVVDFLVSSNLDASNQPLASLILNFKAVQGDINQANAYFRRLTSIPLSQCPNTAALISYADLLRGKNQWSLARELVLFMESRGLIPFPRLKRFVINSAVANKPLWQGKSSEATDSGNMHEPQKQVSGDAEVALDSFNISSPPVVDMSNVTLSQRQLKRYHHYYMSPTLGQFQDPLAVEALAHETKTKVKAHRASNELAVRYQRHSLALQIHAGNRQANSVIYRVPTSLDLYKLSQCGEEARTVSGYIGRDSEGIEGLLGFLLGLIGINTTPGPVPQELSLDISNPLIYDDVVAIVQSVLWDSDYLVSFANANVWALVNDITAAMGRMPNPEESLHSNEGSSTFEAPSRVKELTGPRDDYSCIFPSLPSKLFPGYLARRIAQRPLFRGQKDVDVESDSGEEGFSKEQGGHTTPTLLEKSQVGPPEDCESADLWGDVDAATNTPFTVHQRMLLRRRNTFIGIISAALYHGNRFRLASHAEDKKLSKLITSIEQSKKEDETPPEATKEDGYYRNFLLYGATVNNINNGLIGKNNPNRVKLLRAQEQLDAIREASVPVLDVVLDVLRRMQHEHDGALVSLMDASFCQDVLSLLARAGNAYNSMVGVPFKPTRVTELRIEQYSKFYQVFLILTSGDSPNKRARILRSLAPVISPSKYGAQHGTDDQVDLQRVLDYVEKDCNISRMTFPSAVHERFVEGFFRAGSVREAKAYFMSVEPSYSNQSEGGNHQTTPHSPPPSLSARVYEIYITRLLRERDTSAALDALLLLEAKHGLEDRNVVKAPGYSPGEGLANDPEPGVNGNQEQGIMAELLRKEEDEGASDTETDELQAIIDKQLQQGATEEPHTSSPLSSTLSSGSSTGAVNPQPPKTTAMSPEMRLMLTTLYGKVLNVYRMTSRTSEVRGLIQRIRRKKLDLDASQAHSLMDIEIRQKNFHGAIDLYNQFFSPLPQVSLKEPVLGHEGEETIAPGGLTAQCPDLKAVIALARALTRVVYPDRAESASTPLHTDSPHDAARSRRLAQQASGYILNIIHHFQELRAQTRVLSSVYGVVSRLARLATEAGEVEATLALYTFIPLRDRRRAPWAIISKQLADVSSTGGDDDRTGICREDGSPIFAAIEGRAELCLLLMRAEGQKGDLSGGMSPLSLLTTISSVHSSASLSTGRFGDTSSPDTGADSLIYDPYTQFTPPTDDPNDSTAGNRVEDKSSGASGTVDISAEVIGHALKALVLPHKESAAYHPVLRNAVAHRALALAPALFATMHHYKQYPIWPLTFLYFAAGGLGDKSRGANEARLLHYRAYRALLDASMDGGNHGAGHNVAPEDAPKDWVESSIDSITEVDANLLLLAALAEPARDSVGEEYIAALLTAMKGARHRVYDGIFSYAKAGQLDVPQSLFDLPSTSAPTHSLQGGSLTEAAGALFAGLRPVPAPETGQERSDTEECLCLDQDRVELYGEMVACDVLGKFQRCSKEMTALGLLMLEVATTARPRKALEASEPQHLHSLNRVMALEQEVARLLSGEYEPGVVFPALEGTPDGHPVVKGGDAGDEVSDGGERRERRATSEAKLGSTRASLGATRALVKGEDEVLGNLARNLQEQQRRQVLRTGRQAKLKKKWDG